MKSGAFDGIAADPDRGGLAEALPRSLEHRLIGEGARSARRCPPSRRQRMFPGMMPILQAPAVITPGQLGPISIDLEPLRARFTRTMSATGMPSVMHTMRRNFRIDCFRDGVRGAGRRHVDDARVAAGLGARLRDGVEHRETQMGRAALAGRGAADHAGAVIDGRLRMKGAVLAGKTLAEDLGVAVDEDGHAFLLKGGPRKRSLSGRAQAREDAGVVADRGGKHKPAHRR